ncbi:hypothetical protein HZA57_08205 [Candidatus Poribacteria bacterium]|nr:hypothetical protein [Candidatus Poribacteria bacterium]
MKIRFSPIRSVLILVTLLLASAAAQIPARLAWLVAGSAAAAAVLAFVMLADTRMNEWLRGQAGRPVGPLAFVTDCFPWLSLAFALCAGAFLGLVQERLGPSGVWLAVVRVGWIGSGLVFAAGAIKGLFGNDPEAHEVRQRLTVPPLAEQFSLAWVTQRRCFLWLLMAFIKLTLAAVVALLAVWIAGIGFAMLGWLLSSNAAALSWSGSPALVRAGIIGAACASFYIWMVHKLTLFRLTETGREQGRPGRLSIWEHLDRAMGAAGLWPTIIVGVWIGILLWGLTFAGHELLGPALSGQASPAVALAIEMAVSILVLWALVLLPGQWTLPILVHRDCGWMRAYEVSFRLFLMEMPRSLVVGICSALMGLTVILIPAAWALRLGALPSLAPLLSLLLKERRLRDIFAEVDSEEAAGQDLPATVAEAYKLLDEGKYLDGVNRFQMFLLNNRENTMAMRGEALGLLYLGNVAQARERLERWLRAQPGAPEAEGLLEEVRRGLWNEGGARYEAMKARSREDIGKGLTNRDIIGLDTK